MGNRRGGLGIWKRVAEGRQGINGRGCKKGVEEPLERGETAEALEGETLEGKEIEGCRDE